MVPKFRAWDKEGKLYQDEEVSIVRGQFVKSSYAAAWWMKEAELFNVQQSTGLKGKNGVEIFEGDIVSVRNHPFQKTEKSGAGIEIDGDYAISWNEGDLTWCAGNLLLARLKPYVTVAGNIYENPELLDQSNES